jgi:hypothetical protein
MHTILLEEIGNTGTDSTEELEPSRKLYLDFIPDGP